jgi:hypothetical protein
VFSSTSGFPVHEEDHAVCNTPWRNSISSVTQIIVMPPLASSLITSSTSLIIPVERVGGQLEQHDLRREAARDRHRAAAGRPDSCSAACAPFRTRATTLQLLQRAFVGILLCRLLTHIGASVRFEHHVWNRLNCWNTMPTSRRTISIAFTSSW